MVGELVRTIFRKPLLAIEVIQEYKNWQFFFLDHFGFLRNRELVYLLRNGIRLKARAGRGDSGTINEIWLQKRYAPVGDELRNGATVVDIGAHIGAFSIYAAAYSEGVRVYSYEPHPENFRLLRENIQLNQLDNIMPYPVAVAAVRGRTKLYLWEADSLGHSLLGPGRNYVEVKCTTLKDIMDSNEIEVCALMKVDCEGAEYEILFNTPNEIFSRIERIHLEYHPDVAGHRHSHSGAELVELLEKMGFEIESVTMPTRQGCFGYIRAINRSSRQDRPR